MKEKSAEEMFEELGYKIDEDDERLLIYDTNITDRWIYKVVFFKNADSKFRLKIYEQYMSMYLLQAINKKCQELGWLSE